MYISISLFTDAFPLYQTLSTTSPFLAAGVISLLFQSCLAWPFFTIAGAMATATLALNIYSKYDYQAVRLFKEKALDFQQQYPRLQIITFLFILAVSLVSLTLSCILALLFGAYAGVLIDADQCKRNQMAREREQQHDLFALI
jgi:hypothetical protein